jgi:hypothetical protein
MLAMGVTAGLAPAPGRISHGWVRDIALAGTVFYALSILWRSH